jgi:hypothetical protein
MVPRSYWEKNLDFIGMNDEHDSDSLQQELQSLFGASSFSQTSNSFF